MVNSLPLNLSFQGSNLSNAASQDSGIDVIETAFSRAKPQKRMMQRPPTASGGQAVDNTSTGLNQNRPYTGPQNKKPPKATANTLDFKDSYKGSQGSNMVSGTNLNFAPKTGGGLAGTNFMSEGDFERESEESSYYYEEEDGDG